MALNFPSNPTNGQTYQGYVYSTAVGAWQAKPAAQSPFYTSDTPPANPITGDSWFNTNDGTMYIYVYDGNTYQWVEHRSQIAKSQVGLVPVVPTSVTVDSGTGSVDVSGKVTFTGASAIRLNGAFTGSYRNYRIVAQSTGSLTTATDLMIRLRASGSDETTALYQLSTSWSGTSGATFGGGGDPAMQQLYLGYAANFALNSISLDMLSPAVSGVQSGYIGVASGPFSTSGGRSYIGGGSLRNTNAYDGFTLFAASGTISGELKVYGYN